LRPIRKGDRGVAVEDVQHRLISIGADLGPSGVDGVFLGATYSAVRAFQRERGLDEDGEVGPHTWAALVDATFALGDRLLYLRFPFLHGEDVRIVQGALNALGFAVGGIDGIFGAFSERGVRDFQANTGIAVDGVVGPDTVRALDGLRHAWVGRSEQPPTELRASAARSASVLVGRRVTIVADEATWVIAERVANLALASEPGAVVDVVGRHPGDAADVVIELANDAAAGITPIVAGDDSAALTGAVADLVARRGPQGRWALVIAGGPSLDDHSIQALAACLLDGLCRGLGGS
jgi:peptidoglycan hydrolase-like protein with peptidoglycan-binding domain